MEGPAAGCQGLHLNESKHLMQVRGCQNKYALLKKSIEVG